jgi:hypothetical protein
MEGNMDVNLLDMLHVFKSHYNWIYGYLIEVFQDELLLTSIVSISGAVQEFSKGGGGGPTLSKKFNPNFFLSRTRKKKITLSVGTPAS